MTTPSLAQLTEDLNRNINAELERRAMEWIATAKGVDFAELLATTTRERNVLKTEVEQLRQEVGRLRAEVKEHEVTRKGLQNQLDDLHSAILDIPPH